MKQYNSITEVIESLKTDEITPKQAVSIVCKAMRIIDLTKPEITKQYVIDELVKIESNEIEKPIFFGISLDEENNNFNMREVWERMTTN
jgi:hypothetical protein